MKIITTILTLMLSITCLNGKSIVTATSEQNPTFKITDDYIIIEHIKIHF